jgi:hypothetical protein
MSPAGAYYHQEIFSCSYSKTVYLVVFACVYAGQNVWVKVKLSL